jgi:hypothetical protein
METKKCSNCGKWMIKWGSGLIIDTFPSRHEIAWICSCGHREDFGFVNESDAMNLMSNGGHFKCEWEKANGE